MPLMPLATRALLRVVLTAALVLAGTPLGTANASPDFAILKTRNGAQRSDVDAGHPTSELDGALLHTEEMLVDDGGAVPLAVRPGVPALSAPTAWTWLGAADGTVAVPALRAARPRGRAPPPA